MQRSMILFLFALLMVSRAMAAQLEARHDMSAGTISIFRSGEDKPILMQNARPDFRPYIHPIVAPDGRGVLTEYSPAHHPHQTGLYWGFTRVNGRDYFHHPKGDYWRRVLAMVLKPKSSPTDLNVRWQTVYDLLDADGKAIDEVMLQVNDEGRLSIARKRDV
ncbi:MAG: PmoA family protein [Planctomycetes bacterium]|nr:PmoA family protein [Planctomycetota bacterium]